MNKEKNISTRIENKIEGTWISSDPDDSADFDIEYVITKKNKSFKIVATDSDGEKLIIKDILWDGRMMTFKSFMSSTKRKAVNTFKVKSDGKIEAKFIFTIRDELKKLSPEDKSLKDLLADKKFNKANSHCASDPMEGVWGAELSGFPEEYVRVYFIEKVSGIYKIHAKDLTDNEKFQISNIESAKGRLKFKSRMPSTQREGVNEFRITINERIETQFTFCVKEELEKKNK